jgi:hypothetical protein
MTNAARGRLRLPDVFHLQGQQDDFYLMTTARCLMGERCVKFARKIHMNAEKTQDDVAARETCDICDVNAHWPTVEATHRGATAPDLDSSSGKLASTNNLTTTA